mmetsp:Transcript_24702/g.36587  ORF Transcript_24702/g.36587 Transcript_24702/m.36587 type:complete len:109 (+) Transcript_24702:526-852(+)
MSSLSRSCPVDCVIAVFGSVELFKVVHERYHHLVNEVIELGGIYIGWDLHCRTLVLDCCGMVEARLMPSRSRLIDSSTSGSFFSFVSLLLLDLPFLTVADFDFADFFD